MASTTVRYQMDKEQRQQLPCWPDNGGLGDATTTENSFDEYVTFDPNDFLGDPQSPSAILEAPDDGVPNSSPNDQDIFPVLSSSSFAEDAACFDFPSSIPEQSLLLPAFLTGAEPVLGGAESISDSELLRLEGISIKSPREEIAEPVSPSLLLQPSPNKKSRFVESVYATFRRATGSSGPSRTHTAALDMFNADTIPQPHLPHGSYEYTTDPLDLKSEPIDNSGLPLSPPLTGKIPYSGSSFAANGAFVTGNIEDPFCDKIMAPHMGNDVSTPLSTPALKDDFFFPTTVSNLDPRSTKVCRLKQRNASSAEWPLDGIISDDSPRQWSATASSSYIPDNNALHSPSWWDINEPSTPSSQAPMPLLNNSGFHDGTASFEHNQSMHHQSELPYEYTPELSGLMIHMPQPRLPQAAVLSANIPEQLMTPTHHASAVQNSSHGHHSQHRGRYADHRHHLHRRPQPRAPSSGARHLHHGASMTSPRKPSLHRSGSRAMLVHREESVSPSPGSSGQQHHRPRRVASSSSLSVRKQRSWSRAPRTPNPSGRSHSSSFGGNSGSPGGGAGGGGGGVDFVNFTPSDKNLLMTGVAPSGSSKTKARREKEAADRRRRISEAAVKAVQAAGGDVDTLVMDDFVF
ncbi:hypothetical protein PFICI_05990 [Pestalotiopsis fici W106-1]|uniref:Developmental regulatory protein wetA n=1 Tax=Pestalotiopsis fici (strain W106-1 / CGMCC3.15140) TaxID=1229662 RepID=W3X4B9_PESFW|nr:uncharacterized protein PFICI_05990 [Pestalotiopsis fici W106-1]ETS80988.1 hypothetical protein PFICI_05990 [Pestalotiopsis fici W106-1]